MMYADIIADINIDSLDRTYQYIIPRELDERVQVGSQVMVPFGRGNRCIKGYVVGISDQLKVSPDRIKSIAGMSQGAVSATENLLRLAWWMKNRYGSTMNEAIKTVLPVKKAVRDVTKKNIVLATDRERAKAYLSELGTKKNAAARIRLLSALIHSEGLDYRVAASTLNISKATVDSLMNQGIVKVISEKIYRNPLMDSREADKKVILNQSQLNARQSILDIYFRREGGRVLLHGVTGSGKTEVYMSVIEEVIKDGRQVIMLIPEIALTYQTMQRFYARFGDRVSILNSRMSAGERYDQYERAKNNEIDIIIGPRSALFVPFEKLGMIIIDEEHENSYKSEMPPKYHAREVADKLSEYNNAVLVMGSATPSVETYYRSEPDYKGDDHIIRIEMNERCGGASLPAAHIVDMREELRQKNYSMISRKLREKLSECLSKNEQAMLFINRRGYSGFVSCRSCGESITCPHCDVSLTIHHNRGKEKLLCHYCGYETEMIKKCPKCSSSYIGGFGVGTQKVEEMIKKEWPHVRTLRMDSDTTSGKNGHSKILETFKKHEADILIGTQMIVKGHDFPLVTVVGILAADMTLNMSDYRAAESTYTLLVQAAGRAGRSERAGEVVIQTYSPENYAVVNAAKQNYREYYEQEILYRSIMKYPPIAYIMTIFVSSASERLSEEIIQHSALVCSRIIGKKTTAAIMGPAPHRISKMNDMFRYQLFVKSNDIVFLNGIRDTVDKIIQEKYQGVTYSIQFDIE